MKCLVCDTPLRSGFDHPPDADLPRHDSIDTVDDALFFRATGNYGSAIFDSSEDDFIEITVCDACIMSKAESHGIRHARLDRGQVIGEEVFRDWRDTGAGAEWLKGQDDKGAIS